MAQRDSCNTSSGHGYDNKKTWKIGQYIAADQDIYEDTNITGIAPFFCSSFSSSHTSATTANFY